MGTEVQERIRMAQDLARAARVLRTLRVDLDEASRDVEDGRSVRVETAALAVERLAEIFRDMAKLPLVKSGADEFCGDTYEAMADVAAKAAAKLRESDGYDEGMALLAVLEMAATRPTVEIEEAEAA